MLIQCCLINLVNLFKILGILGFVIRRPDRNYTEFILS